LTRRSYVNKEGKTVYVTEVVVDAINSIGSRKDNNSGLSIPNVNETKPEPTKSIDASFPEHVVKQSEGHDVHKPEAPSYENKQDVE
jgi:single-stranded DNA-binding protein